MSTPSSLGRVPLFRSLPPEAVAQLDRACAWLRAQAREWVLDYQDEGTDLYFVVRGHVRAVITGADRETILRDINDGEFFGELAAIDGQPRSAGIVAITDTVLAAMPAQTFRRAIHAHPDVCDQVLATLVARVRALANRANEVSALSVKHRLYAELLRLARPAGESPVVSPPPTHAELAGRVNSHREAITRELNAMERAGLIERRRGAIVVVDATRLRQEVANAFAS